MKNTQCLKRKLGDGNMATTFATERSVVLNINKQSIF